MRPIMTCLGPSIQLRTLTVCPWVHLALELCIWAVPVTVCDGERIRHDVLGIPCVWLSPVVLGLPLLLLLPAPGEVNP